VDFATFDANQYNYFLSELPLTSQELFVESQLYLHHRINISDSQNVITSDLPAGVEFAVLIPDSTERLDSIDIEYIDRIAKPWTWCESWQGYSLTAKDYLTYNPSEARSYPSSFVKLDSATEYELVVNSNGQYQVNFFISLDNVANALSSNFIQIDFHINHIFSPLEYEILEDTNTYNSKLMWKFPNDGFDSWKLFSYHPDLTRTAAFNVSFFHISEYAQMEDWKSSFTEELTFFPYEYNFTEFTFSKFEGQYYEVSLNLSHGGDYEYIQETGIWELIKPFGMNIQTHSGERFVEDNFIIDWRHDNAYPYQPIFTFKLRDFSFERMGILEDSNILVTYSYPKETYSYYTLKDEILYGDSFSFTITDSNGNTIQNEEVLASIKGNNITFIENIKNYLGFGEKFTVRFEAKTQGGLLETKHIFVEVQPYEMKFYNKIYPFSGCSIIAPLYYNLSSQYQYQLALNYRLLEKSALENTTELHNKYQHYHEFQIDLTTNRVMLTNWTVGQAQEENLFPNLESTHLIYDMDPQEAISHGIVKQISAFLNCSNKLTYYLSEELNDPGNGWLNYDTLIMKLGVLNSDILSHINVDFYYTNFFGDDCLIDSSTITLDMIEGEEGVMYLRLPKSTEFNKFTVKNNARMVFTPVFYDDTDFQGYFYEEGFPFMDLIEWDENLVVDGNLKIDLEREVNPLCEIVLIFNDVMELIYEIPVQAENNTILLPNTYIDSLGNLIMLKDGDVLFLKYNTILQQSIGLIIEDMVLQRAPYIENFKKGEFGEPDFVPFAELSLLGINSVEEQFLDIEDLYNNRNELVAWDVPLDLTPFEDAFWNNYHQKVINISVDDVKQDFKTIDGKGNEHVFITDVLISSNDPRYQIVIDSFFIFEFDSNATIYDSGVYDIYQNNHMEQIYFGNYSDIYQNSIIFNVSEFLPLYHDNPEIDESLYFEAFDRRGNYYYFGEHLLSNKTSQGIYEFNWNPSFSEEYYYALQDSEITNEKLDDLYQFYQPHIDKFNYLYISWSDSNAWREWQTLEQPNIDTDSLEIMYEWFDETISDYNSVSYNQSFNEVETRQIAIEKLYPYNITSSTATFQLSQDYSQGTYLVIMSIEGYYFNESKVEFDVASGVLLSDKKSIEITAPNGIRLDTFEKIIVLVGFKKGAYSDYSQFRLTSSAISNHPEAPVWTKNDTLYIAYEYNDLNYFLLFEDYSVGNEDSAFEYLEYTRNKKFVVDVNDMYIFDPGTQQIDFELFNGSDDLRTCLEMKDFDMNGVHEYVVEKQDITGDGAYNSFKYGFVNPAGDISFHTLIQKVETSQIYTERNGEVKESKSFELNWKDLWRKYNVVAQTVVTNNITTDTSISKMNLLIQKDFESDGTIDGEVLFEAIYTNVKVTTYTEENTTLNFYPTIGINPQPVAQEYLVEKTVSTYNYSDVSCSFVFKEFENNEVISTRLYQDIFPNELTELNNIESYLTAISCDNGDTDPSNDIITEAPYLEGLLTLSHPEDGIPSVFESKTIIQDGQILNVNLLSTEVALKFPGGHQYYTGFYGCSTDNNIKGQVIKVTPSEGVFYDNTYQFGPQKVIGSYLYYDSNNDNRFETIFIVDEYNNVLDVGFDYDGDGHFLPNKMNLVKKQVELTKNSAEHKEDIYNILTYALDNPYGDLLRFNETHSTYRLEPTLSDSMFELWKIANEGSSSKLLKEVSDKKANEFIENVWNKRLGEDILWQVEAQAIAIVGAAIGAGIGSIIPGLGNVLGAKIGYILTYATANIIRSLNQQRELDNYIAHQSFYNTNFRGYQTLSSKWWMDTWFGDIPTNALFGSSQGVYAPIKRQTALHEYNGEIILSPSGVEKTDSLLGDGYRHLILDYSLQVNNLVAYSDFDNWMLEAFLQKINGFGWNTDPIFMHSENSVIYLEDQVSSATAQNEDILFDSIMPYMVYSVPTLEFADSQGSISQPEFYETHPIYVSAEKYEQVKTDYNIVYKISDLETSELQLIPKASIHYLHSDVISINVYLVWSVTNPLYSADYSFIETLEAEDFQFDPLTGLLTISDIKTMELIEKLKPKQEKYPEKELALCFEVHIEKYRSIENLKDLSREEVDQIVTMQTAHANVLEYYYQFNLASKQEEQLQELAYTAVVTAISTAISIGVSFGIGKVVGLANKYLGSLVNLPDLSGVVAIQSVPKVQQFLHGFSTYLMQASVSLSGFSIAIACIKEISQEIFIDPLVETFVSNLVREMGYDATIQMIASTLAESLREEFSGQISGMFKGSQSDFTFQNYMDKRLTIDNQYPIGQELIQYFNQYKAELTTSQDKKYNLRLLGALGSSLKMFTAAVTAYSLSKLANSKKELIIKSLGIGVGVLISAPIISFLTLSYGIVGVAISAGLITSMFGMLKNSGVVKKNGLCRRNGNNNYIMHDYLLVSNYDEYKEISCKDCGALVGIYDLPETIFKLKQIKLRELDAQKNTGDITIYRISWKKNPKNSHFSFPHLSYAGQTYKNSKTRFFEHFYSAMDPSKNPNQKTWFENSIAKHGFTRKEFAKYFKLEVLQIIRFQGNRDYLHTISNLPERQRLIESAVENTEGMADLAEKFWVGFLKSQFQRFGRNTEEGGRHPRSFKLIPLVDMADVFETLKSDFLAISSPRAKALELLQIKHPGTKRNDLENSLKFYYGTNKITDVLKDMIFEDIDKLFRMYFRAGEITRFLNIKDHKHGTFMKVAVARIIKEKYSHLVPPGTLKKLEYIKRVVISEEIISLIKQGFITINDLRAKLPGFKTKGQFTNFIRKNLGGLEKMVEKYQPTIKIPIFKRTKEIFDTSKKLGTKFTMSYLLTELSNAGLIKKFNIGTMLSSPSKYINKIFGTNFNDIKLFCATGKLYLSGQVFKLNFF